MGQVILSVLVIVAWVITGIMALAVAIVVLPIKIRAKGLGKVSEFSELTMKNTEAAMELDGSFLLGLLRLRGNLISGEKAPQKGMESRVDVKLFGFTVKEFKKGEKALSEHKTLPEPGKSDKGSQGRPSNLRGQKSERDGKEKPKKTRASLEDAKRLLAKEVRKSVLHAVKKLIRAFHLRLEIDAEIGLSDPSYTGMVYGWTLSALGALGIRGVRLAPNFTQEILKVDGSLSLFFSPLHVLWILGTFLFSKRIRPLWRKAKPKEDRAKDKPEDEAVLENVVSTSSR